MSAHDIKRCWIAEAGSSVKSSLAYICMRFSKEDWDKSIIMNPVGITTTVLPVSKEDKTPEIHLKLGLLTVDSLFELRDAIDKFLAQRDND